MKKPYFAKLLPIEGEINGWVRQKSTGKIYYQKYGNNAMYDKPDGKLQFILSSTIDFEKLKLFLCSRERYIPDVNRMDYSTDDEYYKANPKVIGEILTEGIKEGQEFTEKEAPYLTLKSLQK